MLHWHVVVSSSIRFIIIPNHSFYNIISLIYFKEVIFTLFFSGQVFETHKLMLCACSTFFRSILTKRPDRHPIVFLKDVDPKQLEQLLQYMYQVSLEILGILIIYR